MNNEIKSQDSKFCHLSITDIKDTMKLLSGKWKLPIIAFMFKNGKARFMDLQRGMRCISARILSKELQELCRNEIVSRTGISLKPIIVEYELTSHGQTLDSVVSELATWRAINSSKPTI